MLIVCGWDEIIRSLKFVSVYVYFKRKPQMFEGWIVDDILFCIMHSFHFIQYP